MECFRPVLIYHLLRVGVDYEKFVPVPEMNERERDIEAESALAVMRHQQVIAIGRPQQLELPARGLTAAESRSLLETWRDELFTSAAPRAIYLVPRHLYDRMHPLSITPTPAETVRVGLVIESL